MSSLTRATTKGSKNTKTDATSKSHKQDKPDTHKIEKNKGGKMSDKNQQHTSDGVRSTKYKDIKSEDPNIKEKINTVVETTRRSEEDAFFALHECGFDTNSAVNMLIENSDQEWVTSVRKKKNRQSTTANKKEEVVEETVDEFEEYTRLQKALQREKLRLRVEELTRMRERGWRGRENKENEKNLEDAPRRGGRMFNGPSRGGGSGRGGRGGGRLGSRTFQSRDSGGSRSGFSRNTIDTWNSSSSQKQSIETENWDNDFPSPIDDWYNEEYTGSLADTKVFTPSSINENSEEVALATAAVHAAGEVGGSMAPPPEVPSASQQLTQTLELHNQQSAPINTNANIPLPQIPPIQHVPPIPGVGSLTAAQSQYLSQLTQQSAENAKQQTIVSAYAANSSQFTTSNPANSYNNTICNYTAVGTYGNLQDHPNIQQPLPVRTKTQKARVPPPSKIPASAVEMPGDLNSSIGYLDVQFGALDFMDGNSFDSVAEKYSTANNTTIDNSSNNTSNLDLSVKNQTSTLDGFATAPSSTKATQSQPNINTTLSQSQMLSSSDSIPQSSTDHLSSVSANFVQSRNSTSGPVPPSVSVSALDIGKSSDVTHTYSQPQGNSYQSYQSQKVANSVYPSQNYNTNNYQTTSQVSSTSFVSSPATNSYVNSNAGTYINSNSSVNSYQNNSYSNSVSSYQSGSSAFPSITQASGTYPATVNNQSTYQQSSTQSVYGSTAGLSNSSNYSGTSNNQYNSYNTTNNTSTHNHKITGKEQGYDASTSNSGVTVTVTSSANVSAPPSLGLANSQTSSNSAATKVTSSSTTKSGVIPNIPPGVAPMMSTQYIMGQAGMPFYQQPMYSYEELQLLQQRVPAHIGAAYYDIGYQTPTTLAAAAAAAREGSIASGAYSMSVSDSRFTRNDNNASPVPSTLSQQTSTQSHQAQPMLSATLPPGYAYFYNAAGMMPGSFQYGTPAAIYPQLPAATNTHGSTNLNQYPKPSNYGSGYGSGYDALTQSQDYTKSGYVSGTQSQTKAGGVGTNAVTSGSTVATDLSVMYGKTHAALGKVNSYEKQGFHSGTPPPFNMAGNQSAGIAPSGTYGPQMYIQTMPHQQHHSTTLMHQPLHQMDLRHQTRRMDSSNSSGQRSQSSSQAKSGAKQAYPNSYWNPA